MVRRVGDTQLVKVIRGIVSGVIRVRVEDQRFVGFAGGDVLPVEFNGNAANRKVGESGNDVLLIV